MQLDINNVFLNDKLEEAIYVKQSSGLDLGFDVRMFRKLKKTFYGIK